MCFKFPANPRAEGRSHQRRPNAWQNHSSACDTLLGGNKGELEGVLGLGNRKRKVYDETWGPGASPATKGRPRCRALRERPIIKSTQSNSIRFRWRRKIQGVKFRAIWALSLERASHQKSNAEIYGRRVFFLTKEGYVTTLKRNSWQRPHCPRPLGTPERGQSGVWSMRCLPFVP